MLIEQGPPLSDPKAVFEGMHGLSLDVALNQAARVRVQLKAKCDPNAKDVDGDRTPLHWAAARGRPKLIVALLRAGALTNARDADGKTPSELAFELRQGGAYTQLESSYSNWPPSFAFQ